MLKIFQYIFANVCVNFPNLILKYDIKLSIFKLFLQAQYNYFILLECDSGGCNAWTAPLFPN